ncbi:collagen binding domain-containing protein [Paenibacillus sp. CGMCC 1.16610]|uniref:LPXTG cell wall anchor domain-containing protein n=2 Tax=Paenibacillus TaxID=44249 RepID=A0ABW9UH83_9BACL|nr:collagen binding domain-containing protein [Paenibacillus sp. CGMCC 1.16610]MVQ38831.1 LPXTG cell wall anchor domain-containing protein [Paenibacillus anseongense]
MLKKELKLLLVILLVFMQCLYAVGVSTKASATEISKTDNILESVTMAVYDSAGQVVTGNVYDQGARVRLDYTWSLPDGHSYRAGDTYTFMLPAQFLLFNNVGGTLTTGDDQVGTFQVNKDSRQVIITFNNFIESHDNVRGTLTINTQFNKSQITGSTTQIITIPIQSGEEVFTLIFRPDVPSTISKAGVANGFNAKQIDWTVDVNKSMDSIQQAVVKDPIPAGLAVPVSVAVYSLGVKLDGTMVLGELLDSSQYTVSTDDSILAVHFADNPITHAYRIQFATAITDATKSSFVNTATLSGSNKTPVQATATVEVKHGSVLKKIATDYATGTQTISWAIQYNYNEGNIPQSAAWLSDLFNESQELIAESFQIFPVTFNGVGGEVLGSLVPSTEYTLTPQTAEGKKGFKLQFLHDISTAYKVIYKTKASKPVLDNSSVTNTVTSGGGSSDTVVKPINQVVLVKSDGHIDYNTKIVEWNIAINGDSQQMSHVVVTDTFPYKGLRLLPDTFKVKQGAGVLDPSEYTLDDSVAPEDGFIVRFKNPLTGPVTINYKTAFNLDWIQPAGSRTDFYNTAQMAWLDRWENEQTKTVTDIFYTRDEVKNNGFKSGTYDAAHKQITWTVGVNYNSKPIEQAVVEDLLESNQKLDAVTLAVYKMVIAPNGTTTLGSIVDTSEYEYQIDAANKLKLSFKQPILGPYSIVFKTSLDGQLINNATVNNTAKLFDASKPVSNDLKATVNIPHGGEYVSKKGLQSGDKINWMITINQGQSTLNDALLIDTPTVNQLLLLDTFHLFKTIVDVNGNVTKGAELTKDVDYTLVIETDASGKQTFRLHFVNPISSAYILEYQSLIAANDRDTVSNKVILSGNNVTTVTKETVQDIIVGVSSGSGTGSGVRGSLSVKKVDASNYTVLLSGATFDLYRKSDRALDRIGTMTTNENGVANFTGLLKGNYVVKESAAPAGYALDADKEYPVSLSSGENYSITVTNTKSTVPSNPPTSTPTDSPSSTPSSTPSNPPSSTPTNPPKHDSSSNDPDPTPSASTSPKPSTSPAPSGSPSPGLGTSPSPSPSLSPSPSPGLSPSPTPAQSNGSAPSLSPQPTTLDGLQPETLPVTGESSHTAVKLSGLALILLGFLLRRKWRKN